MRRAALIPFLLVLAGCTGAAGPETALAKIDGWRDDARAEDMFATLELAYDRATAERLWADNVPEGLAEADGVPLRPGVYGSLADLDLETSVLALWSSGESGSCPGWAHDVRVVDGSVVVDRAQDGQECTDDYNPYRLVLVLDRDDVPAATELPAAMTVGEGIAVPSQVRAYE